MNKLTMKALQVMLLVIGFPMMVSAGVYNAGTYSLNFTTDASNNATITGFTTVPTSSVSLDIPATVTDGGKTYQVTTIYQKAFQNKTVVIGVKFPASITTIGYRAFEGTKITEAVFPADSKLVTIQDNIFASTPITKLVLPNSLTAIPANAFRDLPTLTSVTLPAGLVSIDQDAFNGCGISGDFTLPETLTTLGVRCFANTPNLGSVLFPSNSPVTAIPDAAFFNSGIKNMNFPPNLKSIGNDAYKECKNIATPEISLPVSLETIGDRAFANWRKNLNTAVFPARNKIIFPDGSRLKSIGEEAFRNGTFYGDINLPATVTVIPDRAFLRNEQWDGHITLHEGLTTIGANAFELVGSTQSLVIPASVTTIGKEAFYFSPFSGISFAEGSRLSSLGLSAFKQCFNLSYLDLSSVTALKADNASRAVASTSQYASMPAYTVVYLPTGSSVAANEENFVVDGTCRKFVVYDKDPVYYRINNFTDAGGRIWIGQKSRVVKNEPTPENFGWNRGCDYPIQHEFTATTADYKSRTFAADKGKTFTITLPYDAEVPAGMRAYQLKRLTENRDQYYFLSIEGNTMKANEPYVLRMIDAATAMSIPTAGNVKVVPAPQESKQTPEAEDGLKFIGTTVNIFNKDAANKGYYTLSNSIWYPVRTETGTEWTGETPAPEAKTNGYGGYIQSMRAYVYKPQAGAGSNAKFLMFLEDSSETTGIETVEKAIENKTSKIYTIDGRYVGTDFDSLTSGEVYIVNGKKVYKI